MCPQRLRASPTLRTRISITRRQNEQDGAIAFLIKVDMVVWRRFAAADCREVGRSLARQAPPVSDIQQHLSARLRSLSHTEIRQNTSMLQISTASNISSCLTDGFRATIIIMFALYSRRQLNCDSSLQICHRTILPQVAPLRATTSRMLQGDQPRLRSHNHGAPHSLPRVPAKCLHALAHILLILTASAPRP